MLIKIKTKAVVGYCCLTKYSASSNASTIVIRFKEWPEGLLNKDIEWRALNKTFRTRVIQNTVWQSFNRQICRIPVKRLAFSPFLIKKKIVMAFIKLILLKLRPMLSLSTHNNVKYFIDSKL